MNKLDFAPVHVLTLAAGQSSRFGSPKQLAPFDGRPLLAHSAKMLASLKLGLNLSGTSVRTNLVLGANADLIAQSVELDCWDKVVLCQSWQYGMWRSIVTGFGAILSRQADVRGCVVHLPDQPLVSGQYLLKLIAAGLPGNMLVASSYFESVGVPAYFPRSEMQCFLEYCKDDQSDDWRGGAKDFILSRPHVCLESADELLDIDTPEDLPLLEQKLKRD